MPFQWIFLRQKKKRNTYTRMVGEFGTLEMLLFFLWLQCNNKAPIDTSSFCDGRPASQAISKQTVRDLACVVFVQKPEVDGRPSGCRREYCDIVSSNLGWKPSGVLHQWKRLAPAWKAGPSAPSRPVIDNTNFLRRETLIKTRYCYPLTPSHGSKLLIPK